MSAVPSTFGKYFLTEKIATGGMAEIFLAKLLGPGGFEKLLIIKKIHPELSHERQFVEMFVAEAKTLVGLSHGNIVPIYELGMVDDTYFIAMEYIDGPSLEELLAALARRGEQVSPAMAAYIAAEALKGLDYAHRKGNGVIHRDLSPRNLMISRDGEVKLVDFGIAVASASKGDASENPAGSYPHMSPEQARGEALDGRSDVFAMGILLWEMLTGRSLFARGDEAETLEAVKSAAIAAPSELRPAAAGVLDAICAKALTRDIEGRYKSAGKFLVDVNRYLYSQMPAVAPEDISSFVAITCPPITGEDSRPRPKSDRGNGTRRVPVRSGTVPMERSGTTPLHAKGKPRAETVRTFATNVNFEDVLANATPIHGVPSIPEALIPSVAETTGAPAPASESADRTEAEHRSREPEATEQVPKMPGPSGSRRRRLPLILLATVLLASAGVAVVSLSSPDEQRRPALDDSRADAAPESDARWQAVSADAAPDASPVDAADRLVDAAPAVKRRRADARRDVAPGSVRVGANPWADVFVDGKPVGRAPGNFEVPAGKHTLELRFQGESRSFPVDIRPGEATSLGVVDFQGD